MRLTIRLSLLATCLLAACQAPGPVASGVPPLKTLSANQTDLAYVEQGTGATVLFVHGAGADWRAWEGLRPLVASRYRFVAMSRRYHHPNAWGDDGRRYSVDQHVDDIAAFIREMKVGRVHLVGNSYGGRLVGYVALRHPELLRSVVLGEPSLIAPGSPEGRAAVAAYAADLGRASAAAKAGDDRQAAILTVNAVMGDAQGFEKWNPARQQRWLDNAKSMGPMYSGRAPAPVTCDQFRALPVPALVVRGASTRENFRHGNEALLACLPETKASAVIPEAQHVWATDNPQAAAAALMAFFDKH